MNRIASKGWNTCGYVRLSREDGGGEESNSVTSQKNLIHDFLSRRPEFRECGMKVDDGYTGLHFQRPAFQEMMEEIRAGKINCVIVKDLSRFGRNYLETGEYLEKIFPFLGVRFIAINDHYDSLEKTAGISGLILPLKNIVNEAYCRDISIKIRSQLEIRRKRGDFTGSFAVYGYRKDPENKNRLVVDPSAAGVVRDIFRWKLEGFSAAAIAKRLNQGGVLSPLAYKTLQGIRLSTPFQRSGQSEWFASTVLRLLKNPVYMGTLIQGKNTTPGYKVKKRAARPREEWAVTENSHEPIIDRHSFESVQQVLALDTRVSPGCETAELFSGRVFCGECGGAMVRKTVPSGGKKYVYYVCAAHKNEKTCFAHCLRDTALGELVEEAVRSCIRGCVNFPALKACLNGAAPNRFSMRSLQARLEQKEEEVRRFRRLLQSLYENLAEDVLDKNEYQEYKEVYTKRYARAAEQAAMLRQEIAAETPGGGRGEDQIAAWETEEKTIAPDHLLIALLIERIFVYKDRKIEIVYRCQDEFQKRLNASELLSGQ